MPAPPTRKIQYFVPFLRLDCTLQQVYYGFRFSFVVPAIDDLILFPLKPIGVPHIDRSLTTFSYKPVRN